MKIISWNVNSIHARLPRVTALLARYRPDLACLQEIETGPGVPAGEFAAVGYQTACGLAPAAGSSGHAGPSLPAVRPWRLHHRNQVTVG